MTEDQKEEMAFNVMIAKTKIMNELVLLEESYGIKIYSISLLKGKTMTYLNVATDGVEILFSL